MCLPGALHRPRRHLVRGRHPAEEQRRQRSAPEERGIELGGQERLVEAGGLQGLRPARRRSRSPGPPGPQGPQGATGADGTNGTNGAPGADGTADAFARVQADGTLQPDIGGFPSQNKGVVVANVTKGEGAAATGTYCFNVDGRIASAIVSLDNADAVAANRNLVVSVALDRGEDLGDCPASHNDARVRIVDGSTETATDARFFIWLEK